MEQGELIDKICGDMYKIAQDKDYGFSQFAVPWGRKDTDAYRQKQIAFSVAMRKFAKKCGVMSLNGSFYYFNGKIYEKVSEFALCQAYDQLMEALGIANQMMNKTTRKELFLGTIQAYNKLRVRNDVVAFSNRVVNIKECDGTSYTGTFRHSPIYHVIDYHPYKYIPNAKAPLFMQYLDYVLPDKTQRDILQMFLGLGLIQTSDAFDKTTAGPRGTVELCLVLLGSGANGKSVLFNIICALFGKNHITNVDYDDITADGDEGLRSRAAIRSAVFNWSSDSDARKFGVKNTAMFKRIVSGEPYPYRLLGQDIAMSDSCPYLIFSLNQLPPISESTRGFLRRLQFVNFDVTIPRYKQDPNLANKIIEKDLPGVFNWVLRGAREVKRRKFCFPTSDISLRTKVKALLPTNPVYAWTMVYGLRGENNAPGELAAVISSDVMYKCFCSFCEFNDADKLTQNKFARSLTALNFVKLHKQAGMYYVCYGANEEQIRQPMSLDKLHQDDEDEPRYESDPNSIIKDD